MKEPIYPNNKLTVIIRDSAPLIFLDSTPTYRSVTIELTDEQLEKLRLRWCGTDRGREIYEDISMCFIEPKIKEESR